MWVENGSRRYVKHYLIDFASTLGMGAGGPFPVANMEYGVDLSASTGRLLGLGLHEDAWRSLERPEGLPEVGFFEAERFDPMEWKPLEPNVAFANLTERDGSWAAKIVSSFTEAQIDAAVAEGAYPHPEAARYVARTLAARRDKIARYWFDRVAPLDFFVWEEGTLRFHDLGVERELYPGTTPRYRVRLAACDADRRTAAWSAWVEGAEPRFDLALAAGAPPGDPAAADRPFLAIDVAVDRGDGDGWRGPIRTYVSRRGGHVVAVDR
jgi:hypothetical protein